MWDILLVTQNSEERFSVALLSEREQKRERLNAIRVLVKNSIEPPANGLASARLALPEDLRLL